MGGQKYKTCFGQNNTIYVGEGKRRSITLTEKLEVIKRFERNERTCDIVRTTGIKESTLRRIRDNAGKIKASIDAGTSRSAGKSVRMRSKPIEEMEQILRVWIEGQTESLSEISLPVIKQKALLIYNNLRRKNGDPSDMQRFCASTTWFTGFRYRFFAFQNLTGKQISKSSQPVMTTTLEPREVLPNIETELSERIDFESSPIETINEMKEEFQEDQSDCDVSMMVNENQLSDVTHQEADSVIMDAYDDPSSKRFLVVPEYQNRMMLSLASMWKQQKMCDASIGNGTTIIKIHKVVLLAISPTLLSSSEVRDDCFLRVKFPANISENAMRAFAEYMYNGVLDLDPLTLTQLQQISYQLGIEELCLLCETHLYSQTQDAENIIFPGTSLSHPATQSDTSSWVQSSQGQDFILPDPVAVKAEPQDSVQGYGSMGPVFPAHLEITTNMALSVNEPVYSQGSTSVAKASKIPKTSQQHSQTLELPVVSQIKRELLNQNVIEYGQHRSTLSSESSTSTSTRLPPKSDRIRATTNRSNPPKLCSGPSPAIGTVSNHQQTFSKSQREAVKSLSTPSSSSGNKVVRPTHEDASLKTIVGNNSFGSNLRNKSSTLHKPYPAMLFPSELETLPHNISQTAKMEQYIDLTS